MYTTTFVFACDEVETSFLEGIHTACSDVLTPFVSGGTAVWRQCHRHSATGTVTVGVLCCVRLFIQVRADRRESGAHQFQGAAAVRVAVEALVRAARRAGGGPRGVHEPDATGATGEKVKQRSKDPKDPIMQRSMCWSCQALDSVCYCRKERSSETINKPDPILLNCLTAVLCLSS